MATESFFSNASLAYLASAGAGKDGKTYSIKPTDGSGDFTFSRGSNLAATRVGPTGLIEKGRENLVKQSNNFGTTWATIDSNVTSGQSGYDGSSNAWELDATTAGGRLYQSINFSGVHTFSIYAKKGTANGIRVRLQQTAVANAYVDLRDGSLFGSDNAIDVDIQDVSNGWYRITFALNASSVSLILLYPTDGEVSQTTGSIYIQDAQVESGLAATDYIESGASTGKAGLLEDEPRFDYSGGATCPSLLLEPSRTNLIEQSEYFEGYFSFGVTLTTNYGTSPEGLQNSTRVVFDAGGDALYKSLSVGSGDETASIYVKGTSGETITFGKGAGVASGDLYTLNGDWQRITYSGTNLGATFHITTYNGATARDIEIWGAQVEAGSYPTSYIPNHSGGTITRGADLTDRGANLSYTGNYTLFMEFNLTEDAAYILNATTLSAWSMYVEGSFAGFQFGRTGGDAGGVSFASSFDWSAAIGTNVKIALVKNGTSAAMFVNGTKYTPSANTLSTGNEVFDWRYLNYTTTTTRHKQNYINQLLEFEEALSDADCITLTTI